MRRQKISFDKVVHQTSKHMATPPSYPPTPPKSSAPSSSTSKKTRKETHLRSLATRPMAKRPTVHVDPTTGKADGPHRKKLRTYLGIITRDKVEFYILEVPDQRTRKKSSDHRKFKSNLTSKWALANNKEGEDNKVRKKAQAIQKQNTTPHVLSRGGYDFLEEKLMEDKKKKRLEEATQSESTDTIWKMTHIKKSSQMTFDAIKEIVDRIDSLEEQATQGSFVAYRRQDVLTVALGGPEHPARVRATRVGVMTKQYFGLASKSSHTSTSMAFEDLEQLTKNQGLVGGGLVPPPEPEVSPSAACVDPSRKDPNTGASDRRGLYVNENSPCLVAIARVYVGSTTVHNVPLGNDQVKDKQEPNGPSKPVDKSDPDVSWDATMFGVYNDNFPLYIKHEDLSEIAHGGQCLSIFAYDWDKYASWESLYEWIHRSIRFEQSQFESRDYIKKWMQNSKRDVYLGAYLNRLDNYLKGIINRSAVFCNTFTLSLIFDINILIVQYTCMFLLISALKEFNNSQGSKSKVAARWILVKTIGTRENERNSHSVGKILSKS
ncbi:hypothetical protein HKD37_14G039854 [Glycine soja]